MKAGKYKSILKERWKFYLSGYLIGYFVPIILYGVPSWKYLMPIKIMGIACAAGIGTAFYYGSKKVTMIEGFYRAVRSTIFALGIILFLFILKELILRIWGIDITPYIDMPAPTK